MAYRTYRNLYRIRPSLSSIGQGRYRIRLPRGMQITGDTAILTAVLWLPCSITVGPFLSYYIPLGPFLLGLGVAGIIGYQLSKLDPAGKTVVLYLYDFVRYLFRSKVHDGWESRPNPKGRPESVSWSARVSLVEDGRVASLPAKGRVTQLELRVPAHVKVKKGEVIIQHRGKRLSPGWYEITEGKVMPKRLPPKLKRS
ncbi:TcpE family conjugal transfer membrane protein [Collibacillus ludicampi]|uniref:TcpE family conjugal transfer membrane protein n=1 Tax=Collibacillus ludicampi TaxID=2771369 RepID=UPI0024955DA5|nr:TcpE family conjugal transfer membrane protein [Collibacillus ludicampi]